MTEKVKKVDPKPVGIIVRTEGAYHNKGSATITFYYKRVKR